jgi:hypothetical protein
VLRLVLAMGLSQSGFHAFIASMPLAMAAVGRPRPLGEFHRVAVVVRVAVREQDVGRLELVG